MGKVLKFQNGFPGTVSRSVDDVIISLKNAGSAAIPFGAPVFMNSAGNGIEPFNTSSAQAFTAFVGFAVRAADKTPATVGANEGNWAAGELAEILVRGSMVVSIAGANKRGMPVYIKKSDGSLTTTAGSEGTTVELTNVKVRTPRDSSGKAEIVVTSRNIQ